MKLTHSRDEPAALFIKASTLKRMFRLLPLKAFSAEKHMPRLIIFHVLSPKVRLSPVYSHRETSV